MLLDKMELQKKFRLKFVIHNVSKAINQHRLSCKTYLDAIALFSCGSDTHLKHLDFILSKLIDLKFTVNVKKKCSFAKPEIKYLGHVIRSGWHGWDPEKLCAIESIEVHTTKTNF